MENIILNYDGSQSISKNIRVGNVGSGDLEILLKPTKNQQINIHITTSIDNHQAIWEAIFARYFDENTPSMDVVINDFGATPGVIGLRLAQALEKDGVQTPAASVRAQDNLSFIELEARERVRYLLDEGTFRELLDSSRPAYSQWLLEQNIVPQSDDGCVVGKGEINGKAAVVVAIEAKFQGGAIGEISGAKMAAALELALADSQNGKPTPVVLLLETGGVRLQEANLGLAAIADIHAGIVALRQHVPVVCVIAGTVGCFGGMSIAAGLCSSIIITQEGRLGLNGPQVIEQEAGIAEYDSRDKPFIWSLTGGEARFNSHFADVFAEDDAKQIREQVKQALNTTTTGDNALPRCEQIDKFLAIFAAMDTQVQASPDSVRQAFDGGNDND